MKIKIIILAVVVIFLIGAIWFGSDYLLKGQNGYQTNGQVATLRTGYCKLLGGEMIETGCGIAACTTKCSIRNRDAGKACQSSKDCSGKCVISVPSFDQCRKINDQKFDCTNTGLKPVCQAKILKNCEYGYEYDHGMVTEFGNCML